MKRTSIIVAALVIAALTATSAYAASAHFKKGGTPVCQVSGGGTTSTSTVCSGTLAGLGGGDLAINTTVAGDAVYQCQNGGGQTAPGQNRVLVGPSTTPTNISGEAIKNGTLSFTTNPANLSAASSVSGAAAGCPNSNWTGVNPQLRLTSIELTIAQGGQLLFTCTASNSSGLSGRVPLSCS